MEILYPKVLKGLHPALDVRSVSGQQLAGYFEHGHPDPAAYEALLDEVAADICSHLYEASPASLILGCTHYPHMRAALAARLPKTVTLVDPANAMVAKLNNVIQNQLAALPQHAATQDNAVIFTVTGDADRFQAVAQQCSGLVVERVQKWSSPTTKPVIAV